MAMAVQVAGLWLPNSSSSTHTHFLLCRNNNLKPPPSSTSLSATASLSSPPPSIQARICSFLSCSFYTTKGFLFCGWIFFGWIIRVERIDISEKPLFFGRLLVAGELRAGTKMEVPIWMGSERGRMMIGVTWMLNFITGPGNCVLFR